MNQEQVDAMCPEERRRREEVKREVSDASRCGHDAFQSKDPVVEGAQGMSRPTAARDG